MEHVQRVQKEKHHEIRAVLPMAFQPCWQANYFPHRHRTDWNVGSLGAMFSLQRYLAAHHQHLHNDHHLSDGFTDPEHP